MNFSDYDDRRICICGWRHCVYFGKLAEIKVHGYGVPGTCLILLQRAANNRPCVLCVPCIWLNELISVVILTVLC